MEERKTRGEKLQFENTGGGRVRFMVAHFTSSRFLFLFFREMKRYRLLFVILSFSSIYLLISAEETLDILMPNAIAAHVRVLQYSIGNRTLCHLIRSMITCVHHMK